tara:strand:- start:2802 stop:4328 length:1527 start_codon:yes stop_codon:yes gene_type:complete
MAITNGDNLNSIPAAQRQVLSTNYIDFTSSDTAGWAQQYLPDLMEKEAEVFGNRTISGFLEQVGAEESMTSDQVVWSEQGRLHLSYIATMSDVSNNYIDIVSDIDGNSLADDGAGGNFYVDNSSANQQDHGIRVNDMLLIASASANVTTRVIVSAIVADGSANAGRLTVLPYNSGAGSSAIALSNLGFVTTASDLRVLVYGSEYKKGDNGRTGAVSPTFKSFTNKPIIMKDKYEISGSDASAIGWVEVSGEDGQNGYMWYLKAEGDTRQRFTDYMEMSMIESIKGVAANTTADTAVLQANFGTEGLFAAIEDRGNTTTGVTGVNAATDLAEFDAILAEFDKQGAIEENMMFVNRATALAMDDMLASMNSYGAGGTSYGVFDNEEDMALNLGFSGFRRGSYDFYKSDWKYLNDFSTRGAINSADDVNGVRGVIIPAGVSSVYDQNLGKNLKRPFLHVRYRASQTDDRRFKTWTTGSVGATTSDLDAMEIHYLSERCLVVQGANNFMIMK